MTCNSCQAKTTRILTTKDGRDRCPNCYPMAITGKSQDRLITRSSQRVRDQQIQFEGDMIPPHTYDKTERKLKPNQDFLDRFPEQAHNYFTPTELKKAGVASKYHKKKEAKDNEPIEHKGSAKKAIKKIVGKNPNKTGNR